MHTFSETRRGTRTKGNAKIQLPEFTANSMRNMSGYGFCPKSERYIDTKKICGSHSTCNTEVFSIHCGHLVHPICLQVAWLWHACALLLVYSSGFMDLFGGVGVPTCLQLCTIRNGLKTIREWASKMQTHFEDNARAVVSRSAFCPSDKG